MIPKITNETENIIAARINSIIFVSSNSARIMQMTAKIKAVTFPFIDSKIIRTV
jgi:hypothetical protein